MSKRITSIVIVALIVLQLITLSKVSALQQELHNTRNQLMMESSNMRNEVSRIYGNVNDLLEEQASILDGYDYELGDLDEETLSVSVHFTVLPKQLSDSETAVLYVNGQEVQMERQWMSFLADVDVSLMDTLEARVVLEEQGVQRGETLEMANYRLWERYIPSFYAHYHGQSSFRDGEFVLEGSVELEGVKEMSNGITIESTELVVMLDGKVIERIIPGNHGAELYEDIPEMKDFLMQEILLDKSYEMQANQTLKLVVVAHDSLGLIHNIVVRDIEVESDGSSIVENESYWMYHDEQIIADSQGNVLVGPEDYQIVQ